MKLIAKGNVRHNGVSYKSGTLLPEMEEEQSARLIRLGAAEEQTDFFGDEPEGFELPTIEDFVSLKASEQKKILEGLDIEPASKAESRIKQYADFYDQGDIEDEDHSDPDNLDGKLTQSAGTDPVADTGADDEHF